MRIISSEQQVYASLLFRNIYGLLYFCQLFNMFQLTFIYSSREADFKEIKIIL